MCKYSEGTLFKLLALGATFFALTFQVISLGVPFWISVPQADGTVWNLGLWLNCSNTNCRPSSDMPGWIRSTQAFKVMALMEGMVCLVCILLYTYKPSKITRKRKWPAIVITLLPFIAAILEQIAIGIFIRGAYHEDSYPNAPGHFSWGLGFSILVVVFFAAVCVFLFIDLVRRFYGDPIKIKRLTEI